MNSVLHGWKLTATDPHALLDCSLIIPTYARSAEVQALLRVLVSISEPPAEVVIVDGASSSSLESALWQWASNRRLPFDLIYVASPRGLTRQRNIGIDLSSKRFIYFLDDDATPLQNYFRAIRDVFLNDSTFEVGGVSGFVLATPGATTPLRWRIRLATGLVRKAEPLRYLPSGNAIPGAFMKPFSGIREVDVMPGCAFSFRREALQLERFSEFFSGYSFGEDVELCLRLRRKWKLVCCGDAHVRHGHAPGGRPAGFERGTMEVRNRHFLWCRHVPNARLTDRARFWLDIAMMISLDLGSAAILRRHPLHSLVHAGGLLWGAICSIARPTRFQEPATFRRYQLASNVPTPSNT